MHLGLAAPKLLCDPRLGAHELLSRLHEDPDALLSFSELGAAQADGIVLGHKISWYGAGLCGWRLRGVDHGWPCYALVAHDCYKLEAPSEHFVHNVGSWRSDGAHPFTHGIRLEKLLIETSRTSI